MLTQAEYDAAMAEELTARSAPQVQTDYGWFVDAVLDEAENRLDVSAETLLAGGGEDPEEVMQGLPHRYDARPGHAAHHGRAVPDGCLSR